MGNNGSTQQEEGSREPEIEEAHEGHQDECAGCEQQEECKPEPYNPNLAATVGYYSRAVIVCSGALDWPAKLEKAKGTFVHSLCTAIKARDDIKESPKVTACGEPSSGEGYDIYVYPDEVKYIGVKEEDIPVFLEDQIVKGEVSTRLKHISVSGKYHVLVCTHGNRDRKCGRAGPQVLTALQQWKSSKDSSVSDRFIVDGCSHVGGHKYAGVVVVYPPGDFYGYAGAKNIDTIVDFYLGKKPKAQQYWRGRMGTDEEQQAKEAGLQGPPKKKDKGKQRGGNGGGEQKGKGEEKGDKEKGESIDSNLNLG